MKNCPADVSGPRGPWYKHVNDLVKQAQAFSTRDEVIELLGEPDKSYQDSGENVLEYDHPYKEGMKFTFAFTREVEVPARPPLSPADFHFADVVVRTPNRSSPSSGEVASLESQLGIRLPAGYADYLHRFGEGTLSDTVRVYPPSRIRDEIVQTRTRWNEYYFWDSTLLSKEQVLASAVVADTVDGDEVIVTNNDKLGIFVLPRNAETIHYAGATLEEAVGWILFAGLLYPDGVEKLYFDAFGDPEGSVTTS